LAQQKKVELKDELTKELATKADLAVIEAKLEKMEAKLEKEMLKLDKKFTTMFLIIAFLIVFINKEAIELIIRLLPFAK
jgi:DNA-binding GntR family transcriptional regulator